MKYDFVVLGATGMQGRIVSRDLLEKGYKVLLCGRNLSRIEKLLKLHKTDFKYMDLRDVENTANVIKKSGTRVVINCAEGDVNLNVLKACAQAGVSSLDLGSEIPMTKDQFKMHNLLKNKGLTHITGCGSVPGIGSIMLAYAAQRFDTLKSIEVGFAWNSNIKKFVVPFSIPSIIEEFTDPATNIERGRFKNETPMDTVRLRKDRFVGKEEEFSVRHPETYTFYHYFKKMGLKNVRFIAGFPLHSFNVISKIIELGLGSEKDIIVGGVKVAPVDVVGEVLKNIPIPEGYKEKEDLWVDIYGKKNNKKKRIKMQCVVPTIKGWEDAGCNIDTGMPASIMAQMVKNGIIKERGCFAPEAVVPPQPFFEELSKRSMKVYENGKLIN